MEDAGILPLYWQKLYWAARKGFVVSIRTAASRHRRGSSSLAQVSRRRWTLPRVQRRSAVRDQEEDA